MTTPEGSANIDQYFLSIQRELELRLERSRQQNTDTEAKGVAAERFVGELFGRYLAPSIPTFRRQIIDARGGKSDEVDLIFCNWAQPSVETELLLAEGVDYAIGVKSVLTKPEIRSLVKNARSVKRLDRVLGLGETAFASDAAGELFIDRIPYIGIALDSQLTYETAYACLEECLSDVEPLEQIDALFILGRGAMINSRGRFNIGGAQISDWVVLPDPDKVLLEFFNFAIGLVPRVVRSGVALMPYLQQVGSVRLSQFAESDGLSLLLGTDKTPKG